ncbi:conserved Plasmodium protein, unknown function [Plasmodium knowlesi strain H]|uniref:Uncharacterized protein n=3 Tax=Plasmodium knowlesi TaxID=5850 RepID=A0A5K1VGJ1_PLAKH|nr:uncharacterized protein PKNH_0102000 [Plasmodium knowlesi strain H]OTN68620.1 Uncharacterized protein PKNOH_S01010300 [Plasmodium knowlesi]CAA9986104.1 conserved Plasmodium protein, unknown function [Plasmodium knowlesi strain H]SBO25263.1 conserved Plasmodium protein, unknown function [Plasmodium knowlesi strain H]SBO27600.1 conserved Plasmodium protein, unknown function [Plasmodium knowlesi strain H]VVS75578.1 conserved Plasmodium protein, unknown function [Plasmodium knowlesi strain H]|eukprot:XP_002257515.1 [Plasmodium knowlesi strain H]
MLKKKKDTNVKEKLKTNTDAMSKKNWGGNAKAQMIDKEEDFKHLEEKEHEIEKISRRIYEENSKIKKINLHHKIIKEEFEKKKLIDQSDKKKKNTPDYYKKITTKLQNNINNIEEYINNITNDINILKSSIDDERNERIIYNNNMKILVNEYNTLKKNISNLATQEKEQNSQNEKLRVELNELVKEKDNLEKKHREDFKMLQQKLKEQKILSSEQKIHELIKMKYNCKERRNNKAGEGSEDELERRNERQATSSTATNDNNSRNLSGEGNFANDNYCLLEEAEYEDEKKRKLNAKIILLKKLCLRILFINEYQKQNIKKLEENIENMNKAINSISILTSKKGDFDHIIINLNASKEKNYSLISRINLLNYETNVLTKLNKKMKEKFKNINLQNDEMSNLKKEITNKMNDKINHIKTSLLNNQETCKLKKKCFHDCVMYLKCLYDFIKQFENMNNKLNLRTQIINKEKNFHFNYIHKYNEEILVDENHLNDFLIFIEKYIYALNFYLPSPTFNYKNFIIENPNFSLLGSALSAHSVDVGSNENAQISALNCVNSENELGVSEGISPQEDESLINEPVSKGPINVDPLSVDNTNHGVDQLASIPTEGNQAEEHHTEINEKNFASNKVGNDPSETYQKEEEHQDQYIKENEISDNQIDQHTAANSERENLNAQVEKEDHMLEDGHQKVEEEEKNAIEGEEPKGKGPQSESEPSDNLEGGNGQHRNDLLNGVNEGDASEVAPKEGTSTGEQVEDESTPNEEEVKVSNEEEVIVPSEEEVKVSNEEEVKVPSEEEVKMPSEEEVKMPSEEEVKMPSEEEVKVSNEEEVIVPSEEEVKVSNEEEVKVPSEEEVKMPSEEEVKMPSEEEVKMPSEEEVKVSNEEEVIVPSEEEVKVSNEEEVKVPNEEEVKVPSEEEVKVSNEEEVKVPNEEEVKVPNEEEVKVPNEEEVIVPNEEEVNTPEEKLINTPTDTQENSLNEEPLNAPNEVQATPLAVDLEGENQNYNLNHFNSRSIEYDKLKEEIPAELLMKKYDSKKSPTTAN